MKYKFFHAFFFVVLLTAITTSCKHTISVSDVSDVDGIITAFTPASIPSYEKVRIEFAEAHGPTDILDHPVKGLLSFSPQLKGSAFWTGQGRILEFRPEKGSFASGQQYYCTLKTGKIVNGKKDFVFKFGIAPKEAKIRVYGVYSKDRDLAEIQGMIEFSEPVKDGVVKESLISCSGVTFPSRYEISVEKHSDFAYGFSIDGIEKKKERRNVTVSFNARKIGYSAVKDVSVNIPAANEFKVRSFERVDASSPYIDIDFSERLSDSQDLTGLISVKETENISLQRKYGSSVRVFIPADSHDITLLVSKDVKNYNGTTLEKDVEEFLPEGPKAPAVEVPLSGTILPDRANLKIPFKAVNLRAVDVSVVKIYTDNILMFLQGNDIDGSTQLRRAGRLIYRKTARLDGNEALDLHEWQNFSVDLSGLFRQERGAIYRIKFSFKKEYSLYGQDEYECGVPLLNEEKGVTVADNQKWDTPYESYYWDDDDENYYYSWSERDDPTSESYYHQDYRFPQYNLAASNLGLVVKSSDKGMLWTAVSDIMTTAPLSGVTVTAYNYQLRPVGSGVTDASGFADFRISGQPFVVTASAGGATSYLKVTPGKEKSLSRFDVGGKSITRGIKGYAYGERGVWRPGDTLHVTFVLSEKNRQIPQNHPVTMTVTTPEGQFYKRLVQTSGKDGFYVFTLPTKENDPTGTWKAEFDAGGAVFHKDLKIETIKPNRLKISFTTNDGMFVPESSDTVSVEAHWLTGPVAVGLNTRLEATVNKVLHPFKGYEEFVFNDPLSEYSSEEFSLGESVTDSVGVALVPTAIPVINKAPGLLSANVVCRVEEPGGGSSITARSIPLSPFDCYVGVKLGEKEFETDKDLVFPVVAMSPEGKVQKGRELEYKIYRLGWSWWWESGDQQLDAYMKDGNATVVKEGKLISDGTDASVRFRVSYPGWGRYLLLVKDAGGHRTGGTFYVDWPLWRGHSDKADPDAVSMLSFSLDKKSYEVGETATAYFPAAAGGRVLVSFENASGVFARHWVSTKAREETAFRFVVTKAMTPNFYVHATLLQPHGNTVNDLPIRLYGVQPVFITDKSSHLHPVIDAPESIRPQQPFTVRVREKSGIPMTYTLAIVDEGLLDLTSFRTPNPWGTMNEREALGVTTWDIYDDVIGAYAGSWSKVLSIGGDETLHSGAKKDNRFKPVVKFVGPFTLQGGSASHKFKFPMYTGSVRIMVVAGHAGAWGNAERTMAVRSPLMLVPTLPRKLSVTEKVSLPVNVFATEDGIGEVTVSVKTDGPISLEDNGNQSLRLDRKGDGMVTFNLKADGRKTGPARVTVSARGGKHSAEETIDIEVTNPAVPMVSRERITLGPGEERALSWDAFQAGDREGVSLEVSSFPKLSLEDAFRYVNDYGHLCTEQLSSCGMFLLYAGRFLPTAQQKQVASRLKDIIEELYSRQLPVGGFAYWPGGTYINEWASSMAGQVLVEAARQGHQVSKRVVSDWKNSQMKAVKKYKPEEGRLDDLQQAYRLYTLALAGVNDAAAMNRLRESANLSSQAKWRLAAAYAVAGKTVTARDILKDDTYAPTEPSDWYSTFWSSGRDDAMKLETLVLLGDREAALREAGYVADSFNEGYYGTQELAFTSLALGRLAALVGTERPAFRIDGQTVKPGKCVSITQLDSESGATSVRNDGKDSLTVVLSCSRLPHPDSLARASSHGVSIDVKWLDADGKARIIPSRMAQGRDFYASITVKDVSGFIHTRKMALTFQCPSGWEIWNDRLYGGHTATRGDAEHKDIRDDKVQWYFDLSSGQSKTFKVRLQASYEGEFLMTPAVCEDMYDTRYCANTAGAKVSVTR